MTISKTGIDLIRHFEGLKLESYLCPAGIWTIGFGTTTGIKKGMQITESKAEELLRKDLDYFEDCILTFVETDITQNQFDALVSFTYNLGENALHKSTLLKKINAGCFLEAADEFLKWNKARNKDGQLRPLAGLTRRRAAERLLFLSDTKLQDILNKIDKMAIPRPLEDI